MTKEERVACPYCGASIRKDAKSCPECGSDENTGWSEQTYLDGIDLKEDFDYQEMLESEFGSREKGSVKASWWRWWKIVVAAVVVLTFLLSFLARL